MKKKLLSILLVLSLMLALVPAAFAADTGTLEGGLTWTLDDGGLLTISGEGAIPDNNAGPCIWADMNVTVIEIGTGVTAIGAHAFQGCDEVEYVYLSDTVETLGTGALSGMSALQAISVDEANPAFTERDGTLYTKDGKTLVQASAVVTEFVVPDGVTAIGSYAFSGYEQLRHVYFPAGGLTTIGSNAFYGCTQLTDIILPDGLTRIEYRGDTWLLGAGRGHHSRERHGGPRLLVYGLHCAHGCVLHRHAGAVGRRAHRHFLRQPV